MAAAGKFEFPVAEATEKLGDEELGVSESQWFIIKDAHCT